MPSLGEIGLYAFNLAQLRNTSLVAEHFESLKMATNLMLSDWSNKGVNLWKVELVTVPLVQGTSTYSVDPSIVMVLDAYMTIDNGSGNPIDRIILPIARTDYASYPNKQQQGFTTTYWFDRLISPTITLWPVPDGVSANYLKYYAVTQVQDAYLTNGQTVDIPYRWLNAFAKGLAFELACIWNPQIAVSLRALADDAYKTAATQDTENAAMYVSPQISTYFR